MSIKITYFVHGTTTDNEGGLSTGWSQGELSELGKTQAKELGDLTSDKNFDVVFCSDLKRAVDSAHLAFENKYKIVQDERLRECNYGDLNGEKEDKVVYEEHIDVPFSNGESMQDVESRLNSFVNFLKKEYNGKQVAVLAHKAPQLALEVILNGKTWHQAIEEDWRKVGKWQAGWEYVIV